VDKKKNIKQAPKKATASARTELATLKKQPDYYIIFLWIMIGIVSMIRYRLISVPFERDEGEYGYIGNLFLHGIAPFKNAYSMKLPGTSFMYAILMSIFGHTNNGVHLGLLFLNAATMYFLYVSLKKIFNPFIGLTTASIYGLMAIGLVFDGFAAHATHFICFFSSVGLFFLADYMRSGKALKVFLFGLMLGMAFLMKQQAVFLIMFGGIYILAFLKMEKKKNIPEIFKSISIFGAGVFIPYLVVLLIITVSGQFHIFWLWTVDYASKYEAVKSMDYIITLFNITFGPAWDAFYFIWILALGGVLVLYMSSYTRLQKIFSITYLVASACVVSAGFYFRQHYFIAILPALGLMSAIFLDFIIRKIPALKSSKAPLIVLSVVVLVTILTNKTYYFTYAPKVVCSIAYWGNPFNEAQEISKYIQDNTKDTDKIAVLGSEPEIYFYANRTAATGYLYTYPLVENQPYNLAMQEQMVSEIEKSKPAYMVFCNISYSWLTQKGSPKKIFEWGDKYIHDNYSPVGFADFFKDKGWQLFWGDDIKNRTNQPESSVIVLKRNAENKI